MSDQEKQGWREWLGAHPEWVMPLALFFTRNPGVVRPLPGMPGGGMFFHDLVNVLTPFYMMHGRNK